MKSKEELKKLKQRYVDAGYADPKAKWRWCKKDKAWNLPLKDIVLNEK